MRQSNGTPLACLVTVALCISPTHSVGQLSRTTYGVGAGGISAPGFLGLDISISREQTFFSVIYSHLAVDLGIRPTAPDSRYEFEDSYIGEVSLGKSCWDSEAKKTVEDSRCARVLGALHAEFGLSAPVREDDNLLVGFGARLGVPGGWYGSFSYRIAGRQGNNWTSVGARAGKNFIQALVSFGFPRRRSEESPPIYLPEIVPIRGV